MNSVKTVAVVAVFLGVVYGVYQVINNQETYIENDEPIIGEDGKEIVGPLGVEIDPTNLTDEELDEILFGEGDFDSDDEDMASGDFEFNIDTGDGSDSGDFSGSADVVQDSGDSTGGDFASEDSLNTFEQQPPSTQPNINKPSTTPPGPGPAEKTGEAPKDNTFGSATPAQPNSDFTSSNDSKQGGVETAGVNNGFSSQPPDPVAAIANSFNAKVDQVKAEVDQAKSNADLVKSEAKNAFNKMPDFMAAAKNSASDLVGRTKDELKQKENATKTAASNALSNLMAGTANKASEFLAPANATPARAKKDPMPFEQQTITGDIDLAGVLGRAEIQIEQGKYREALESLSAYYGNPRMSESEREELFKWLDPLAGKVIYSTEHLLGNAYVVKTGDSLEKIAAKYSVSPQLIYNINRVNISNPRLIAPGTPLKVVQGPFNARIDLASNELTLFLGKMYAGRFVVSMGEASPKSAGRFTIKQKSENGKDYVAANGSIISSDDPANPYGKYWMELDSGAAIHSSATSGSGIDSRGSISLSPIDAEDVYGILTAGSQVIIR